ncbi:MAG TPA: hypothetical protein VEB39_06090 [Sphingomicrobium sp.]|nr:hypothetical protein [Sphingomicrobium sp.]
MDDELPLPEYRHPFFIEEDREPLPMLFDAEGFPVIQFEPVPQARRRRIGWDADRQRAFVALLARLPSVGAAARAVGMSRRSAYKLLDKPGAEQFAKAWDMALDFGMDRLRGSSIARCLDGGDFVPVIRKGRMVRVEFRRNDGLAVALLSGKGRDVDHYRRGAQIRWRQKREWEAADAARAQAEAARDEAHRDYLREAEEFVARNPGPKPLPRVRTL